MVLEVIPDNLELSSAWNELVMYMEHPEVFFTHEWSLAASRAFRTQLLPKLFLAHESDRLVGIAALAVNVEAPARAFFLTASTADYCDIVSLPEKRKFVLRAVLERGKELGIGNFVLANLPSSSSTISELRHMAKECGFHMISRAAYNCGVVEFGNENQRRTLVQRIARKDREKRGLKKLRTLGSVTLRHIGTTDQARLALRSVVSAQVCRFLEMGRVSPLVCSDRRTFLDELTALLSAAGWLKISQLEANGMPLAWNFGFQFLDSWFWYLPTFLPEYEESSPGTCLLRLLIEDGCTNPALRWLDLGLGDEAYKNRFANQFRKTRQVELSTTISKHVINAGRNILTIIPVRYPVVGTLLRKLRDGFRLLTARIKQTGPGATTRHAFRVALRPIHSKTEILVFEAPQNVTVDPLQNLIPLRWEHLSEAAMEHAHDPGTLGYLQRSAKRLEGGGTGFVLRGNDGPLSHFLWLTNARGFYLSEIKHKLDVLEPNAIMIFDCWTPAAKCGKSLYSVAIRAAASTIHQQGQVAWIFCSRTNEPSIRGILKANFEYRFSLVRTRWFGFSTVNYRHSSRFTPTDLRDQV